jgi:hypothetical protein
VLKQKNKKDKKQRVKRISSLKIIKSKEDKKHKIKIVKKVFNSIINVKIISKKYRKSTTNKAKIITLNTLSESEKPKNITKPTIICVYIFVLTGSLKDSCFQIVC